MKDKIAATFIKNLVIVFAVTALSMVLCNTCLAQTTGSDVYSYEYTAATSETSPYWAPVSPYYYWWGKPDLDVHIGDPIPSLGEGLWIPVTVHNHWYGVAQNVNLEVYAQKKWIACLNRPPSLRLAEISFEWILGGGSESVWVYWDHPEPGKSLYAQVDSGDLLTTGVYGAVPVSPYFRKKDHSSAGIRVTPSGDPLASWHYQDPYDVAIDLVRNVNFPMGQNVEENETNNWDYCKRYDAITQPGQPLLIPLPIINPVPNSTFSGTITLDANSIDDNMPDTILIGTASKDSADSFVPAPDNVLSFDVAYDKSNPEKEFPAAILINPGITEGPGRPHHFSIIIGGLRIDIYWWRLY